MKIILSIVSNSKLLLGTVILSLHITMINIESLVYNNDFLRKVSFFLI
jgi:hypothetical protein